MKFAKSLFARYPEDMLVCGALVPTIAGTATALDLTYWLWHHKLQAEAQQGADSNYETLL